MTEELNEQLSEDIAPEVIESIEDSEQEAGDEEGSKEEQQQEEGRKAQSDFDSLTAQFNKKSQELEVRYGKLMAAEKQIEVAEGRKPEPTIETESLGAEDYVTNSEMRKFIKGIEAKIDQSSARSESNEEWSAFRSAMGEMVVAYKDKGIPFEDSELDVCRDMLNSMSSNTSPLKAFQVAKGYLEGIAAKKVLSGKITQAEAKAEERNKVRLATMQPEGTSAPAVESETEEQKLMKQLQGASNDDVYDQFFG